jgi:undecaprenyl-phosphate galactose phosphotransferase
MKRLNKIWLIFSLVAADILTLFIAFTAAYFLRRSILPGFISFSRRLLPFGLMLWPGFFALATITILFLALEKHYSHRRSFWDETRSLISSLCLSFVLVILLIFMIRGYELFSRAVIFITWFLSLFLFPLSRHLLKTHLLPSSWWRKKAIVIGPARLTEAVANQIKRNPMLGLEVASCLTIENEASPKNFFSSPSRDISAGKDKISPGIAECLQGPDKLTEPTIIIGAASFDQQSLLQLIEQAEKITPDIRIIPDFGTLFALGVETENLGDILALTIPRNLVKPWNLALKRWLEFGLALFLFLLFLPLMAIIAIAIRLDSSGPIFFRQQRLGHKGKIFYLIKFRSMYPDAAKRLEDFFLQHPEKRKEWEEFQKIRGNDPRVTRIGRWLRRYSLDELPQLINVLRGEMSLVGPRPYLPEEKEALGEKAGLITICRPGITGLWQVSGRNLIPFRERVLLDEYYLRNWSLWLDTVILLKTLRSFLTGEGAY